VLIWFSYGHVRNVLMLPISILLRFLRVDFHLLHLRVGADLLLLALIALGLRRALAAAGQVEAKAALLNGAMNMASIVLVLSAALRIMLKTGNIGPSAQAVGLPRAQSFSPTTEASSLPDVYWIVLDGYGRQDVLSVLYAFDNAQFIAFLTELGFSVAERGTANYTQTTLSLPSTANMVYLPELLADIGVDRASVEDLPPRLRNSAIRTFLEEMGYTTVAFETGYLRTEILDADLYIKPPANGAYSDA
jgi:hypothetical protein